VHYLKSHFSACFGFRSLFLQDGLAGFFKDIHPLLNCEVPSFDLETQPDSQCVKGLDVRIIGVLFDEFLPFFP
jgi:hypothetical protein